VKKRCSGKRGGTTSFKDYRESAAVAAVSTQLAPAAVATTKVEEQDPAVLVVVAAPVVGTGEDDTPVVEGAEQSPPATADPVPKEDETLTTAAPVDPVAI